MRTGSRRCVERWGLPMAARRLTHTSQHTLKYFSGLSNVFRNRVSACKYQCPTICFSIVPADRNVDAPAAGALPDARAGVYGRQHLLGTDHLRHTGEWRESLLVRNPESDCADEFSTGSCVVIAIRLETKWLALRDSYRPPPSYSVFNELITISFPILIIQY